MQHRFGVINGNKGDMAGFWAPANIRIALSYAIHDRVTVGFGTTKDDRLQDFNWKVALLRQTRSNSTPVSISYYGNMTVDARNDEGFYHIQDRYSFFNEIIIAKRFNPNISVQIAPSVSHYNKVDSTIDNDLIAVAFGARFKMSPQTSILIDYTQPVTRFSENNPPPGVSAGVEFSTSGHAFQLFITNYQGLVPQKNIMYNTNDFFNGDFMVGFNITRNYNF